MIVKLLKVLLAVHPLTSYLYLARDFLKLFFHHFVGYEDVFFLELFFFALKNVICLSLFSPALSLPLLVALISVMLFNAGHFQDCFWLFW